VPGRFVEDILFLFCRWFFGISGFKYPWTKPKSQ